MLLEVRGLSTHFFTPDGVVRAVDDVSFDVGYGETLGLVGESGCGKSVYGAVDRPARAEPAGQDRRRARSSSTASTCSSSTTTSMRKLRGKEIGFIFQDPLTSLNPTLTIGYQIARGDPRAHGPVRARPPRTGSSSCWRKVGIPRARERLERLPAPVLGRDAPARDDRDRAVVRPEADPRRRADDRARRHDPGADPRADRAAVGRVRHGRPADHPRPRHRRRDVRPGQRHVRGPDRRDRRRRRAVREAADAVRVGSARLAAAARRRPRRPAPDDRGPAAAAHQRRRMPAGSSPRCPYRARRLPRGRARAHPREATDTSPAAGRRSQAGGSRDRHAAPSRAAGRRCGDATPRTSIEVEDLKVYFPIRPGIFQHEVGHGQGRRRHHRSTSAAARRSASSASPAAARARPAGR